MAYVPNPTDATQPVESVFAKTAAAEFRALKAYVQSIVSGGGLGVATPGQVALFPGIAVLPGWLELDGSLQLRSTFPALWAAAQALGNVVTEAAWAGGQQGAFSSGDLSTNFRLPDWRGVFVRGFNHGKAGSSYDPGRTAGSVQPASQIYDNGGGSGFVQTAVNGSNVAIEDEIFSRGVSYTQLSGGSAQAAGVTFKSMRPINVPAMYCVKT